MNLNYQRFVGSVTGWATKSLAEALILGNETNAAIEEVDFDKI